MLDIGLTICHNRRVAKTTTNKRRNKTLNVLGGKKQMSNANLTVGSQFTTQKSGVAGTIQEIVQNKNGTKRVRLSVNGSDRWTTVK